MKENQFPLYFLHLAKLSIVSNRKIRVALLKATIENQWASRELHTQIISRLGRYRTVGRKLIIHSDSNGKPAKETVQHLQVYGCF
jgi:hypothetical protein